MALLQSNYYTKLNINVTVIDAECSEKDASDQNIEYEVVES